MKKIIISMLLSTFFINLHAQNETAFGGNQLPYKSLSDFKNDTTAFINYNFIDRAEQYKGKTLEFIIHDLQIPVKFLFSNWADRQNINIDGLYLDFYSADAIPILLESTINKPISIFVKWKEIVPRESDFMSLLRQREYNKIIDRYKDFEICEIRVIYPPKSEYTKRKSMLRSSKKDPNYSDFDIHD